MTLPENMTVNSTGNIDTAGEHLARFINWLHDDKGVHYEVDFVLTRWAGCTPGGDRVLAATAGPGALADHHRHPVAGSSICSEYANDLIPITECKGDKLCEGGDEEIPAVGVATDGRLSREVNKKAF